MLRFIARHGLVRMIGGRAVPALLLWDLAMLANRTRRIPAADRWAVRALVVARRRPASRYRHAGRTTVHPRHPSDRVPPPPLDDADVRGLRSGRRHECPLPRVARSRPDRPFDRLRHADAVRL